MIAEQQTKQQTEAFVSKTQQRINEKELIPMEEVGIKKPFEEESITNERLNNEKFILDLWQKLAARVPYKGDDGKYYLKKSAYYKPLMNDEGAMKIITYFRMLSNPSIVLANIKEEEAKIELDHITEDIDNLLAFHGDEMGVNSMDKGSISSLIATNVWHQLTRSISGGERKNMITRIEEQHGDHKVWQNSERKKGWFGGNKS